MVNLKTGFFLAVVFGLFFVFDGFSEGRASTLQIFSSDKKSVVLGGESHKLEKGLVFDRVVWLWGDLIVEAEVREIVVVSGKVTFKASAKVSERLVVVRGKLVIEEGAAVDSSKVDWRPNDVSWNALLTGFSILQGFDWGDVFLWAFIIVWYGFIFIMGIFLFVMFPNLRAATEFRLVNPWNIPWGIAGILGFIVFGLVLVVSLVGWLFLPIYFSFAAFLWLSHHVAFASWLGHWALRRNKSNKFSVLAFVLGFVLWSLTQGIFSAINSAFPLFFWVITWGALVRSVLRKS